MEKLRWEILRERELFPACKVTRKYAAFTMVYEPRSWRSVTWHVSS
jgi:hypothetical protein